MQSVTRGSGCLGALAASLVLIALLSPGTARAQDPGGGGGYGGGDKVTNATPGDPSLATRGKPDVPGADIAGRALREGDFVIIAPETGRLDTVLVRVGSSEKPRVLHRVRPDLPSRFRVQSETGATVLRMRLSLLAVSKRPERRDEPVILAVDGEDPRTIPVKARRFRQVGLGDSLRWLSDPRDIEVPLTEGHHLVEVRAGNGPDAIVGVFQVPTRPVE